MWHDMNPTWLAKQVALDSKSIIETSLITVNLHCISRSFHLNCYLKQLYINNKTEHLSYISGCGMMHIEAFKRRARLSYSQMASGY